MITLTRLNGQAFALNSDLIERVDEVPNTVITMVDGAKYLVAESLPEVIDAVRMFRASIVTLSQGLEMSVPRARLQVVADVREG